MARVRESDRESERERTEGEVGKGRGIRGKNIKECRSLCTCIHDCAYKPFYVHSIRISAGSPQYACTRSQ